MVDGVGRYGWLVERPSRRRRAVGQNSANLPTQTRFTVRRPSAPQLLGTVRRLVPEPTTARLLLVEDDERIGATLHASAATAAASTSTGTAPGPTGSPPRRRCARRWSCSTSASPTSTDSRCAAPARARPDAPIVMLDGARRRVGHRRRTRRRRRSTTSPSRSASPSCSPGSVPSCGEPPTAPRERLDAGPIVVDRGRAAGMARRDGARSPGQGVRSAGATRRGRRQRRVPRDAHGRGLGRALVRLDQDPRLPHRRAAPQDRRTRPAEPDLHAARRRLPLRTGVVSRRILDRDPRPSPWPAIVLFGVPLAVVVSASRSARTQRCASRTKQCSPLARCPATIGTSGDPGRAATWHGWRRARRSTAPDGTLVTGDGPAAAGASGPRRSANQIVSVEHAGHRIVAVPVTADEMVIGTIRAAQPLVRGDVADPPGSWPVLVAIAVALLVPSRRSSPSSSPAASADQSDGSATRQSDSATVTSPSSSRRAGSPRSTRLPTRSPQRRCVSTASCRASGRSRPTRPINCAHRSPGCAPRLETEIAFPRGPTRRCVLTEALDDIGRLERHHQRSVDHREDAATGRGDHRARRPHPHAARQLARPLRRTVAASSSSTSTRAPPSEAIDPSSAR